MRTSLNDVRGMVQVTARSLPHPMAASGAESAPASAVLSGARRRRRARSPSVSPRTVGKRKRGSRVNNRSAERV
jgi:hypothetical protein